MRWRIQFPPATSLTLGSLLLAVRLGGSQKISFQIV